MVTLRAQLDREATPLYELPVVARDGGTPQRSSEVTLRISVRDVNDSPPRFSRELYEAAVPEDAPTGTAVIELSVLDADEEVAELDYYVTAGNDHTAFLVHSSGQVYVSGPLDRETQDSYVLTVTATDGKFSANTTATIQVLDANGE